MRLSVSAARNGALVINIVLTAARRASVWVVFIFILFLLSVIGYWLLTLETQCGMRRFMAMGCNPTVVRGPVQPGLIKKLAGVKEPMGRGGSENEGSGMVWKRHSGTWGKHPIYSRNLANKLRYSMHPNHPFFLVFRGSKA